MIAVLVIALASLAAWFYLMAARGGFWRGPVDDDDSEPEPLQAAPRIAVVVPARNEASLVGASIRSLLTQDYPQVFQIVLVDDQSRDGTGEKARGSAAALGRAERLTIVPGTPIPPGWGGKVWAIKQGIDRIATSPDYVLLADADTVFAPDALRRLVARAEAGGLALVSLFPRQNCESLAERMLMPAFVFFFQMVYPFAWVSRASSPVAAAAGACMLVRWRTLAAAGGIESVRDTLIEDCALAQRLKAHAPIWLGLTGRVRSIRPCPRFADIRLAVARTAYEQLSFSPPLLALVVIAMALTFLAPAALTLLATGFAQASAATAWALMAIAFQPTLRSYGLSPLWGLALPAIAAVYMAFTLDSAIKHMRGLGGLWKERLRAGLSKP